jgi:biopolymer transport protein ExbD
MSLSGLQNALERLLNGRSDKTVFIKAPKGMLYCDVLKVVGAAKDAGGQPIELQVDSLK